MERLQSSVAYRMHPPTTCCYKPHLNSHLDSCGGLCVDSEVCTVILQEARGSRPTRKPLVVLKLTASSWITRDIDWASALLFSLSDLTQMIKRTSSVASKADWLPMALTELAWPSAPCSRTWQALWGMAGSSTQEEETTLRGSVLHVRANNLAWQPLSMGNAHCAVLASKAFVTWKRWICAFSK